ncbi:hypothetical protein MTO96_018399 [Rhipicephalus appendiculatus]
MMDCMSLRANGEETSGKESAYDTDNCIEVTLPNILQLDECLRDNLQPLQGKDDLLVALLGKLIPPLGSLLSSVQLFALFESGKIEDNVCHGEVKITIPNSLGKCVDDTLKLCKEGNTIDISLVESLGKTVGDLLTNTPQDTVSGLLCDIARLLSTVLGQIPGGGILSKPIEQMCKSN